MTDNITGEQVSYTYDQLNRLVQSASSVTGTMAFAYDGFGNLTQQGQTYLSVDATTNQINSAGYQYNANGNVTQTPGPVGYSYDVANRLVSNNAVYNPGNQRVFDGTYLYLYTPEGKLVGKYQPAWSQSGSLAFIQGQPSVYFAGKLIQEQGQWAMTDRLGSVRLKASGERSSYQPYGAEVAPATSDQRTKFATYYRDSAGLDYAGQRYYSNVTGRFLTPDPGQGVSLGNPGTWNKYAYVGGDPVNFNDPQGMMMSLVWEYGTGGVDFSPDLLPLWGPFDWWFNASNSGSTSTSGPAGLLPGGRGGGGQPPAPCNSPIMQSQYLSIFGNMGKDLSVDPLFIMAVALQESGWTLSHVYGTNPSSNGQPLNNLFGSTYAGGNNIPYPTVQASADAWEANWGQYLKNNPPTTIQAFVNDLTGDPTHMYNANPDWKVSIAGGTLINGKTTSGTYNTLTREFTDCNIPIPKGQ